mgnify:CR=1 FL=1
MLNRVQTFSRWLFLVLASLVLAACGSGDGDNVLPVNGVSNYQLTLTGATTLGTNDSTTLAATLLNPDGVTPVANATVSFQLTGAGSLGATNTGTSATATTDATGTAFIRLNGAAQSGAGSVTARYLDPRNNIAQDPHAYVISSGDQVQLVLSKTQVKSGVGDSVTVIAKVTDTNGAFVENRLVTFRLEGSGGLALTRPITNDSGTAEAVFTPGNTDFSNRTVDIVASTSGGTSPAIEGRATIQVVGTSLALTSGAGNNVTINDNISITATLRDGQNAAIPGATVVFSSDSGNIFTPATATTNSSGQATASVTVSNTTGSNSETLRGIVSALNTNGALTLGVSSTSFTILEPVAAAELHTSTNHTIRLRWLADGVAQQNQTILFNATRGTLSAPSALTGPSGEATVTINSGFAGLSTIEARNQAGTLVATRTVEFVAPTAGLITVQAARNVLKSGEQTTVTAIVRDAANINPIKNALVAFSLPADPSGGQITASATTDSAGQAAVTYTAGSLTSPTNGVTIQASVSGVAPAQTSLTVGSSETATFITLGTGNSIRELNTTTYALPYSVLLTDAAGQPLANQTVTLSIYPLKYYKGVYVAGDVWVPSTSTECDNEDIGNRNGLLDNGEDTNTDGALTPGNVITVSSREVTTNSAGFAFFDVLYAQQYGNWIQVELKAGATVTGSESSTKAVFVPPILSDDARLNQAPPGRSYSNPSAVGSPFGRSGVCTDAE